MVRYGMYLALCWGDGVFRWSRFALVAQWIEHRIPNNALPIAIQRIFKRNYKQIV